MHKIQGVGSSGIVGSIKAGEVQMMRGRLRLSDIPNQAMIFHLTFALQRWAACAGDKGRWRNQLCGKVQKKGSTFDDVQVSPVMRQTLLHWAYELTEHDYKAWQEKKRKSK